MVKRGDTGNQVKYLQEMLNRFVNTQLTVDGDFGPGTERVLAKAQKTLGREVRSEVTSEVWNILKNTFLRFDAQFSTTPLVPQNLLEVPPNRQKIPLVKGWNQYGQLISQIARKQGIPVSTALAVLAIESDSEAYGWKNKPVIRFENHVFWRHWGRRFASTFHDHFKFEQGRSWEGHMWRPSPGDPWQKQHTRDKNQEREWRVLTFARTLDDTAALCSTSWGAPQVMGFNHRKIGYGTPQEMVEAFQKDARWQVLGLFDFFQDDARMLPALRKGDFVTFARIYNGKGQAENYGAQIKASAGLAVKMGF